MNTSADPIRRSDRLVIATPLVLSVVVVAAFITSQVISDRYLERLIRPAAATLTKSIGSIEPLNEMRRSLHQISSFGGSEPQARTPTARRQVVATARDAFLRSAALYAEEGPPERGLSVAELASLDVAVSTALASGSPELPPSDDVLAALRTESERVTQDVSRAIDIAVGRARQSRGALLSVRARWYGLSRGLDVLCILAALAGGVLTAWMSRRHLALARRFRELQHEQLAELEQFSGRVAHDILGPLQPISLAATLLESRLKKDPHALELLVRVRRSIQRVQMIVDGLLRFAKAGARPEAGEHVSLWHVLEGVREDLSPSAEEAGITLIIRPVPDVYVACGEAGMTVVLENLIRNAIKYMGEGVRREVEVRAEISDQRMRLDVEDSGPGLARELLQNLFEPYVRGQGARGPGIGLGLATVKRIAESHGGEVGVQSVVGTGSRFWVDLPLSREPQPASAG